MFDLNHRFLQLIAELFDKVSARSCHFYSLIDQRLAFVRSIK